jgi:glycosyltransferase involved in cell wall biosynthesis
MSKKVVIHSLVFNPDGVSTAYIYNDIALGIKNAGHDVLVLTTTPHYNLIDDKVTSQKLTAKFLGVFYTSSFEGIKVVHIPMYKFKSTVLRLLSFVYWHILSSIYLLFTRNIKMILSPSPPLTIGLVSGIIAKLKGAKFIYNVQEIYPDLLIHSGKLKSGIAIHALTALESAVYKLSSHVTTIDEVFYQTILPRINKAEKLKIIPNFVDLDLYNPEQKPYNIPNDFINLANGKKIVLYAGNIGNYQDWDPVIHAAKNIDDENIEFWIIGEGVKKDYLKEQIELFNLVNIRLFPYQKREVVAALNNLAAVHFISINEQIENEGFPSKIYTMLASSKPTIVVAGIYQFLKGKDCSILVSENRSEGFLKSVIELTKNGELAERLGQNGFEIIKQNYSKKVVVSKYVSLIPPHETHQRKHR